MLFYRFTPDKVYDKIVKGNYVDKFTKIEEAAFTEMKKSVRKIVF
ncbi:hypothetical protein BOFE_09480 (plasmid) [Candidatus Borrelia fainii]|uniref:Uncharacterized protein n=1 Tax=Candidatus Borrelia fainii TaxID=2518322 RepID=A0ABN6USR0_9SPIR|nr:hypothetical protein [Candidatus Borrelia fainii]BDU63408.1 hypothetical protein BOFE_09480 [Candidatus Borrelia fainii]